MAGTVFGVTDLPPPKRLTDPPAGPPPPPMPLWQEVKGDKLGWWGIPVWSWIVGPICIAAAIAWMYVNR